jgi:hypothetical protein
MNFVYFYSFCECFLLTAILFVYVIQNFIPRNNDYWIILAVLTK